MEWLSDKNKKGLYINKIFLKFRRTHYKQKKQQSKAKGHRVNGTDLNNNKRSVISSEDYQYYLYYLLLSFKILLRYLILLE